MGETKPQHTGRFSPGCFFISSSLHVRKRIRGFCLPCVSVWLLRGPWCQLRWWAQGIWRHKTGSSADKAAETQAKGAGDNEAGNCNRTFAAGGRHVNAPKLVAIQIKGGDGTLFWLKSISFWTLTGHQDYLCMWSRHKRCYLLTTTWVGNHKSIWPLNPGFVKWTIWFLRLKAFSLLKCDNVNALTGEKHNNQKPSESSSNTVHINVHHNQRTVSHQSTTTLRRCQGKNHNQRWRLLTAIKNCLLSFCPVLEHCSAATNEEFQTDCVESLTTQFWTPHWKLLHSTQITQVPLVV